MARGWSALEVLGEPVRMTIRWAWRRSAPSAIEAGGDVRVLVIGKSLGSLLAGAISDRVLPTAPETPLQHEPSVIDGNIPAGARPCWSAEAPIRRGPRAPPPRGSIEVLEPPGADDMLEVPAIRSSARRVGQMTEAMMAFAERVERRRRKLTPLSAPTRIPPQSSGWTSARVSETSTGGRPDPRPDAARRHRMVRLHQDRGRTCAPVERGFGVLDPDHHRVRDFAGARRRTVTAESPMIMSLLPVFILDRCCDSRGARCSRNPYALKRCDRLGVRPQQIRSGTNRGVGNRAIGFR